MTQIATHRVVVRNDAPASENRIHSDDIARKYGFTGALVPGVTVFGHMTYPLVQAFGERPDANVQRKHRDRRPPVVQINW